LARELPSTASAPDELLTPKQAAQLINKTTSNISYLLQYGRINRYNPAGEVVERCRSGELRVSRAELVSYAARAEERLRSRMSALAMPNMELAFTEVPERERTKHVHRLHPYLGKFIPQLVEYFLTRYFRPGEVVVDPFCGCYDGQTEFLTRRGWVYGRDLNPDDMVGSLESGELRFVKPTRLYKYPHRGKMFKFSGKHVDARE
jgi:hypothetical protein